MKEIGALHCVRWDFGESNFRSLCINITIFTEPDNHDGLFFQMYNLTINDIDFYFGLQTDVDREGVGGTGKGLIFTRWESRNLSDVRPAEAGWSQSAGYEGDFVGIRKHHEWTNHSYQLKIAYMESDDEGDWYGVWIYDLNNSTSDFLGSIRFNLTDSSKSGIANKGVTWTELYHKAIPGTPIPTWHVSIDGIYATSSDGRTIDPVSATPEYREFDNTDIYYDPVTRRIHFLMGPEVNREHAAMVIPLKVSTSAPGRPGKPHLIT